MHKQEYKNNRTINRLLYIITIVILSLVLTFLSMMLIINVPGNSFKTKIDFIATASLIFIVWFLLVAFLVQLVRFLVSLQRLKNNPSDKNAKAIVAKGTKNFKTIAKILKWVFILACAYWFIVLLIMAITFSLEAIHNR